MTQLAGSQARPQRDARGTWQERLLTWRTAVRLGWAVESNWADPVLFLIYSIAKPIASVLMLVVMLQVISNGAASTADLGFVIVGSALWAFVMGGIAGLAWSILDDRERYRMLRYLAILPGSLSVILLGRGTARLLIAGMGSVITLVVACLITGVPIDIGRIDWIMLLVCMAIGLVAVIALGTLMAAVCMQTRQDSWSYPEAVAGALFLLVGAVFPIVVLPQVVQWVGLLMPLTWWIEGIRRAVLPDAASGIGGVGSVWTDVTGTLAPDQGVILVVSLATTAMATLVAFGGYRWSERRARERGLLDQTTGS